MLKKIASLALLLALLLTLSAGALAADTTLTIDAPETLPAVGQTFTVTVRITGNPGLCAAQFTLGFDQSVVDCTAVKLGTVLGGMLSATNPDADSGAIIAAAATSAKTGDGVLGEYTFKVLKSGEPAFALTDGVFTGADGKAIATNVEAPSQKQDTGKTDGQQTSGGTTSGGTAAEATSGDTATAVTAAQTFTDVPATFWGYTSVEKAVQRGLLSGYPDGTFRPQNEMTRAEFVSVLYRMAGSPAVTTSAGFRDVPDTWYTDAVNWAAANKYASGDGVNFNPNGSITRQEVVAILYRYHGGGGLEMLLTGFGVDNLTAFTDKGSVASWATDAMRWAIFNGIISGTSDTTLSPTGTALRAQVAAFFVRYLEK